MNYFLNQFSWIIKLVQVIYVQCVFAQNVRFQTYLYFLTAKLLQYRLFIWHSYCKIKGKDLMDHMDRELSIDHQKSVKRKKIIIGISVLAALIMLFVSIKSFLTPTLNSERIRISVAEIGDVESTVNASGLILPEFEQNITSPIQSKIINVYFQLGEVVKSGDQLIEIDKEVIQNSYNKIVDENELKKIEIKKRKLAVAQSLDDLKANLKIKDLKVRSLESKLEREKKLVKIGASTLINVEQVELDLQIEKMELELLQNQINNQKQTLNTEIEELELELKILARSENELKNKLEESYLRAKKEGVITWIKRDIGANVNSGEILVKIADLNSYKVEGTVSDIHADKLIVGGSAKVRLAGKDFLGVITGVSPSSLDGVISFTIDLDEKKNQFFKPNIRAEVFIILSKSENVVRVKNGPFLTASANQSLFVIQDNKAYRVDAEYGASNFDYVEITKGIKPGDKVIISNMDDYNHMDEIDIN